MVARTSTTSSTQGDPKETWSDIEVWLQRQVVRAANGELRAAQRAGRRSSPLEVAETFALESDEPLELGLTAPRRRAARGDDRPRSTTARRRPASGPPGSSSPAGPRCSPRRSSPGRWPSSRGRSDAAHGRVRADRPRRRGRHRPQADPRRAGAAADVTAGSRRRSACRRYLDEVLFVIDKDSPDALRRTRRELRDEFPARAALLHASSRAGADRVREAAAARRPQERRRRAAELAARGRDRAARPAHAPGGRRDPLPTDASSARSATWSPRARDRARGRRRRGQPRRGGRAGSTGRCGSPSPAGSRPASRRCSTPWSVRSWPRPTRASAPGSSPGTSGRTGRRPSCTCGTVRASSARTAATAARSRSTSGHPSRPSTTSRSVGPPRDCAMSRSSTPRASRRCRRRSRPARRPLLTADDGAPSVADAVLYLLRHAHASDVRFLEAFHDDELAKGTPVNAVGVLSRADEIGLLPSGRARRRGPDRRPLPGRRPDAPAVPGRAAGRRPARAGRRDVARGRVPRSGPDRRAAGRGRRRAAAHRGPVAVPTTRGRR